MMVFGLLTGCVPVLTSPPGSGANDTGAWEAPTNSWPSSTPPTGLEAEGLAEGQVAPDFLLHDQYGDEVALWQFYGMVVVLDVSTMWCSPCQELASEAQAIADDYRDRGFVYVTILAQDLGSDVPDQAELQQWGDAFHLTEPILADSAGYYVQVVPDNAFPGVLLIGRDMQVAKEINPASDDTIRAAIEDAL
jgi:thiol-disulfide isomerase/thioredoxin